jgi:hypothetical protein
MNNQITTIMLSAGLGLGVVAITALPTVGVSANDVSNTRPLAPHKQHHSRKQPSNESGNAKSDRNNAMGTTHGRTPPADLTGQSNTASPTALPGK